MGESTADSGVKAAISKHRRRLDETGVLRRTIEGRTHRPSIQPGVLRSGGRMDRKRALRRRLCDVVDEYMKEDGPR